MIVLKFGGTSVQDAKRMNEVIDITWNQIDKSPVLVSSAMSKVTDSLLEMIQLAGSGNESKAQEILGGLRDRHVSVAEDFLTGSNLEECRGRLGELFTQLGSLIKGLSLLRECSPRSSDAVVSFGEILSTTLLYYRSRERGINVQFIDARWFMKTNEDFTSATPQFEQINPLVRQHIVPEKGKLFITQGFIGSTDKGVTTTLGRGGSDFSATIIGAALGADEVQIWTDVNGIMTSDPRQVPSAQTIPTITYEEAAELAFFGAKVVHPSTIQPAVELGIPVSVRNTMDPAGIFTMIQGEAPGKGLRAIAGKKNITLLTITSSRMLNAYGFLSRIFAVFAKYQTAVDLVATSEVSVSMTIESVKNIDIIKEELSHIGTVKIESEKSIICLVGQELWKDSSFIAQVFGAINPVPIRMISLGSSDINLSLVVPMSEMVGSIQKLHSSFFQGA